MTEYIAILDNNDYELKVQVYNVVAGGNATATATNSDGDILDTITIASGDTGNIFIADSVIKKSDGTTIASVPAEDDYTVIDSVVTVRNSTPTILSTTNVKATETATIDVGDSAIRRSDATLIANVPAEQPYTVADSVVSVEYLNGTPISTNNVKAASSATIQVPNPTTLQDAIDANTATDIANAIDTANKENDVFTDLAPLVTNQTIEDGVSVAQRNTLTRLEFLKQGETPVVYQAGDFGTYNRGRGASFLTLSVNNPNGNTNRFELLGTDVVIDWGLGCYWTKALQPNAILANHISTAAALTLEGLSTWYVPGLAELSSICDMYLGDPLNYAPFNLVIPNFFLLTSEYQPNVATSIKSMFFYATSRGCLPALRTTGQSHPALYIKPF